MWFTNEFLLYSDKLAYETINNLQMAMNLIQVYFILKIWFLIFLCGVKQSNVLFKGKVYKGINPTETVINL